jgi:hypothetical protein
MFEPLKLITVGLAILLLLPIGYVFWSVTRHKARPQAQRIAEVEAAFQKQKKEFSVDTESGSRVLMGISMVETVGFFKRAPWLAFYPRRWVAAIGLAAVATSLVCVIVLLFFPGNTRITARWTKDGPPAISSP